MARLFIIFLFFFFTVSIAVNRKLLGLNKMEKLSHFKLYWHDIVEGGGEPNGGPRGYAVKNSLTTFGMISVIDDPLTMISSKMVGRAQGFYSAASQQKVGLLMAMNFASMEGKYNGSTITILGRNTVFSKVREMPVIGVDFPGLLEDTFRLKLIVLILQPGIDVVVEYSSIIVMSCITD